MPRWLRPFIAIIALSISVFLASEVGLIDLIAQGYGTLTWVFVLVFILPLFTLGLYKLMKRKATPAADHYSIDNLG